MRNIADITPNKGYIRNAYMNELGDMLVEVRIYEILRLWVKHGS